MNEITSRLLDPKLLLFDLDDTLCDYSTARQIRLSLAFGLALEQAGARLSAEEMERLVERSLTLTPHGVDQFPAVLEEVGVKDPAAWQMAADWYVANRFHGLKLFPGSAELLASLRSRQPKRPIGIISNGPADVQRAKVQLLGLEALFDFVLISGEVGIAKPDRRIFEMALALGESASGEAVFIGDSAELDIRGAIDAGLQSIWINPSRAAWPFAGRTPDFTLEHVSQLVKLLDLD